MAIGFRSDTSPTSENLITVDVKGAWTTPAEVRGNSEEAATENKEDYHTCSKNTSEPDNSRPSPPRRRRLLLSTECSFVDNVLPSLVQNPEIELRLITDEPSASLACMNKVPHY